jgi:hypothetical protein
MIRRISEMNGEDERKMRELIAKTKRIARALIAINDWRETSGSNAQKEWKAAVEEAEEFLRHN